MLKLAGMNLFSYMLPSLSRSPVNRLAIDVCTSDPFIKSDDIMLGITSLEIVPLEAPSTTIVSKENVIGNTRTSAEFSHATLMFPIEIGNILPKVYVYELDESFIAFEKIETDIFEI